MNTSPPLGYDRIFCPTHLFCPAMEERGDVKHDLTRANLVAAMASADFRRLPSVREKAQHLRHAGFSYGLIAYGLKAPRSTVQLYCKNPTLRDRPGRPAFLSDEENAKLREYITEQARLHRPVTYAALRAKVCQEYEISIQGSTSRRNFCCFCTLRSRK